MGFELLNHASRAFGRARRGYLRAREALIPSISWIARLDEEVRSDVLERIRALGRAREAPFAFPYTTEVFVSERVPERG